MKILNDCNTLTLRQVLWKTRTSFKKLEYRFSVESIKSENISLPYKTTIPKSNVKANKMVSAKWTYHKKRSFDSDHFTF